MKFCFLFFLNFLDIENSKKLFSTYCISCHVNGNNQIIPEKDLKKKTLEVFGIDNKNALVYQITNGKNSMPAFGSRLKKAEINQISLFLLK